MAHSTLPGVVQHPLQQSLGTHKFISRGYHKIFGIYPSFHLLLITYDGQHGKYYTHTHHTLSIITLWCMFQGLLNNRKQNLPVVKLEESAAENHCAQQSVPKQN